jgi:hypothetical protein
MSAVAPYPCLTKNAVTLSAAKNPAFAFADVLFLSVLVSAASYSLQQQ